ncbi:MAG: cytochrome c maturation protein CcmE [Arenicella sp.]
MTPRQKQRLWVVTAIIAGVSIATALGLRAFKENVTYFLEPSDVASGNFDRANNYRVGGIVKHGSVVRLEDGITTQFKVTDCTADIVVRYQGILPDLFRESQGIVANGKLNQDSVLIASQVLAKHDENYIPNEAAEAVMKAKADKCQPSPEANAKTS